MFPPLLPRPRQLTRLRGRLRLRPGVCIRVEAPDDPFLATTTRALRDGVRARCGLTLPIRRAGSAASPGLVLRREPGPGDAYRLHVTAEGAVVVGSGSAGLRYGVETLTQLVTRDGCLPACCIEDAPDLAVRGLLVDVSRGRVPRIDELRALVVDCARLKLNALLLYVEHGFAFARHPGIAAGSSPLRPAEVRRLDAFAARHHVDLIPCLQSLGHMERILALPRYAHLAESDARWSLATTDPRSVELLRDLYADFLPCFGSRWFHANCDETFDLGRGRSVDRAERIGRGRLFLEHVDRVQELAAGHGKRTLIWADVVHQHPDLIHRIDRNLVLADWDYEAAPDADRVQVFRSHGLDFLVCPGTSSWNALFPRVETSLANIRVWADAARRHGAQGLICTDWGDHGHFNLPGSSRFAFAWAAQQAWSGELEPRRFDRAFSQVCFDDPSGEAARIWRGLGAAQAVGFDVLNGSPLQLLFFDRIGDPSFLQGARPAVLRRTRRRIGAVIDRMDEHPDAFGADTTTRGELRYAADASVFACDKGIAAAEWIAWLRRPSRLDGRGRRRLAGRLRALARAQRGLGRRFRRLWLERSRESELAITTGRIARSAHSLVAAARALERNLAPPPPSPADTSPRAVLDAVRRSTGTGRRA